MLPASAQPATDTIHPYRSFWMAGFEGADHRNAHGTPLDLVRANGHLDHLDDDYRRLAARAAELAGVDASTLQPCTSEQLGLAAARPRHSVLASERTTIMTPLDDALRRFLAERIEFGEPLAASAMAAPAAQRVAGL